MSTLRNDAAGGAARAEGLLQFSTGIWWIDPLTGDLIVEVQTVKGIRQLVQRPITIDELLGFIAAQRSWPDWHLRSEPRERAQPSCPRMLRLERAGPASVLRGIGEWIERLMRASLLRKGDRLL